MGLADSETALAVAVACGDDRGKLQLLPLFDGEFGRDREEARSDSGEREERPPERK